MQIEPIDRSSTTPSEPKSGSAAGLNETEKWASIVGGSALVLMGLQQRSLRGILTAIAGGGLAYHGATADKSLTDKVGEAVGANKPLRVEKSVTINRSADDLYSFWRNFENLPKFMKHLQAISVLDAQRSHWVTKAPLGQTVEWDAQIIQDLPNQLIAWASAEGAQVDNSGFVRFTPIGRDRGTEVKIVIEYAVPGGQLTTAIAKLFGEAPEQQIGDELNRFKQLMETGEIATTEGQSSGRAPLAPA